MSELTYRAPQPLNTGIHEGVPGARFFDAHEEAVYCEIAPQDTGNVEISVSISDTHGYFMDLDQQDRAAAARLIAGEPAPEINSPHPPANAGRYIADITTQPGCPAANMNAFLTRVAWHVRNGIPANITDPEAGTAHISEVAPDGTPPRDTKEVRRHFRYKLVEGGEWHYHSSFRKTLEHGAKEVEVQRTFKSEWAKA